MYATLLSKHSVTERDTLYIFDCPPLAQAARPGQFVEVKLSDGTDPFLRRPISIFDGDGQRTFSLLIRTVGRGTEAMTRWEPGAEVDVIGPLGNGFSLPEGEAGVLLAAGGIGLAPLHYLIRALQQEGRRIRLLFSPRRDEALLQCLSDLEPIETHFAENRTQAAELMDSLLTQEPAPVLACGPEGFLEMTALAAQTHQVPCQLSMERRMGCGFGICVGCAIAIRTEEGLTYKKVCVDGPVFRGEEVAFHEEP